MLCRLSVHYIAIIFTVLFASALPAYAQRPATWTVPDVVGQFNALTERADPMGFHIGDSPNPSTCKHYQGLARIEGADGTPYLIVTRSGNTPEIPGPNDPLCDDSPGETGDGSFIVVRMESRNRDGERFRSNRQTKGHTFDATPPDPRDRVATWFRFQNGIGFPHYGHPGGMQAVGHMLAVAVEHRYQASLPRTVVLFVNMTDPINPEIRSRFSVEAELGEKVGVVALAQLADGHYLMGVTGGSGETLTFYRSTLTDLASWDLSWVLVDQWFADPLSETDFQDPGKYACRTGSVRSQPICLSPDEHDMGRNWPTTGTANGNPHQTLQFIREGNINGALFLAGARGVIWGDDFIDLYRVECDTALCLPGEQVRLKHASTRHMYSEPNAGGDRLANFAAASTFYVSPSQELLLYATEHDNDGPNGTVKAGEWRHVDMVRAGSATFQPTLTVNGPFAIGEGSVGTVSATAKLPVTKAWMQLFTDPNYKGLSVVVDYEDYVLDDYNYLAAFQVLLSYYQRIQSWRWFAPSFCSGQVVADDIFSNSDVPYLRTLSGTGNILGHRDLTQIRDDSGAIDMDRRASGVDFLADCDAYYHTPFDVRWDRDRDGAFESAGSAIDFDATAIDGPAAFSMAVQATHPSGGSALNANASVTVVNVAPAIADFTLTNSAGQRMGVDVTFALVRTPLTVGASFTDPGRADTQSATVNWGDGVVENQSAFSSFTQATGGQKGSLVQRHRYTASGDHLLTLAVRDDDGGESVETMTVRVLTPQEALQEVLTRLDAAIAAAPTATVRAALEKARLELVGRERAEDGALRMLAAGRPDAAAAFVLQAIDRLQSARSLGASVDPLIVMLQQVYLSLTAA